MPRTRSAEISSADEAQLSAALILISRVTGDLAEVMRLMSGEARRAFWSSSATAEDLSTKMSQIRANLDEINPQ